MEGHNGQSGNAVVHLLNANNTISVDYDEKYQCIILDGWTNIDYFKIKYLGYSTPGIYDGDNVIYIVDTYEQCTNDTTNGVEGEYVTRFSILVDVFDMGVGETEITLYALFYDGTVYPLFEFNYVVKSPIDLLYPFDPLIGGSVGDDFDKIVEEGALINYSGYVVHRSGVESIRYQIDDGEWITANLFLADLEVLDDYPYFNNGLNDTPRFNFAIDTSTFLPAHEYTINIGIVTCDGDEIIILTENISIERTETKLFLSEELSAKQTLSPKTAYSWVGQVCDYSVDYQFGIKEDMLEVKVTFPTSCLYGHEIITIIFNPEMKLRGSPLYLYISFSYGTYDIYGHMESTHENSGFVIYNPAYQISYNTLGNGDLSSISFLLPNSFFCVTGVSEDFSLMNFSELGYILGIISFSDDVHTSTNSIVGSNNIWNSEDLDFDILVRNTFLIAFDNYGIIDEEAVTNSKEIIEGIPIDYFGWVVHTDGIEKLSYTIDDGESIEISGLHSRNDVLATFLDYDNGVNITPGFSFNVDTSSLEAGTEHVIKVSAHTFSNLIFTILTDTVTVLETPNEYSNDFNSALDIQNWLLGGAPYTQEGALILGTPGNWVANYNCCYRYDMHNVTIDFTAKAEPGSCFAGFGLRIFDGPNGSGNNVEDSFLYNGRLWNGNELGYGISFDFVNPSGGEETANKFVVAFNYGQMGNSPYFTIDYPNGFNVGEYNTYSFTDCDNILDIYVNDTWLATVYFCDLVNGFYTRAIADMHCSSDSFILTGLHLPRTGKFSFFQRDSYLWIDSLNVYPDNYWEPA